MADRYVIIKDGIAHHAIIADETYASDTCVRTDTGQEGDSYVDGEFISPPKPTTFEFVVTALSTNDPTAIIKENLTGVLCKEGSTVSITIEAQADGALIPLTDYFRTPIVASDGREQIILTQFANGICQAEYKVPESGFWSITQANINKNTDNSIIFLFKGLNIDVAV